MLATASATGRLAPIRDPARHAEDDARKGKAAARSLRDEVTQHLLGDLEVRDHAVTERARGSDRRGRAADHAPRLRADRVYLARLLGERDHRRLEEHDSAPADEDERVRRPKIDREVAASERPPQTHGADPR